jgi:RNA polymerase sigma factor (TIGR02999 family)
LDGASRDLPTVLAAAAAGNAAAAEELLPLVYRELHALAQARMRQESPGNTLQATALVHEAYLRIVGDRESWAGKAHFFAAAALAMRRILVDRGRQRRGQKRGGDWVRMKAEEVERLEANPTLDDPGWEALDRALTELEQEDAGLVQVVHLRYFAGLSVEETAKALDRSARSVSRDWNCARAWLLERLSTEKS